MYLLVRKNDSRFSFRSDRSQGTSGHFVPRVKDDRFVMARSKGNAKKIGTTPNKEYMELRSMSRRPPHSQMVSHELMNVYDDSTAKPQNGSFSVSPDPLLYYN